MFKVHVINDKNKTQSTASEIYAETEKGVVVLSLKYLDENQFVVSSKAYGAYDGFSKSFSDFQKALDFFNEVENAITVQASREKEYFAAQDNLKRITKEYDLARRQVLDLTKPF